MPSYILVKAQDGWDVNNPMVYQTGYLVDVRNINRLGGMQVPPNFIQIEIIDNDDWAGIEEAYCNEWRMEINWEFVSHDYSIDGHRLKVFMKPELVSVSGLNSLTRSQVENFLNNWGAVVFSAAQNEVVFDAVVLDAIKSNGFWDRDVGLVVFTEKDYDQATGIHRVEANYSGSDLIQLDDEVIELFITQRGGAITKHVANKVTFEISRDSVFDIFKQDVKEKTYGFFSRRRFKILQAQIDMALANAGTLSVTQQQFAQYVYNRLDD